MQFKDLPEDIQKVAADTLKAHLSVVDLGKEPKANLENISRNLRDIFVGLYAYDNEKHKDHIQNCCLNKGQQNIKRNITENDKSINSVERLNNSQESIPGNRYPEEATRDLEEATRDLEELLGNRETKLLFLVPVIRQKVQDILEENGIPKEYMPDAMEYSLELVRITPNLTWLDEYQQQFEKGAGTLLSAADKTEQKTDPSVFWNTVQAIARSKVFEFNNINHSGIDTHQSSHREGVSILLTLLQEQGECPQPTSNDTEQ
ncbi:TPA: hypothetical protein ACHKFQ_001600 [Escherichia coli]